MMRMGIEKFTMDEGALELAGGGPEGLESLVKRARLFYTGSHKGREYSREDLKGIVDAFEPGEDVPVQLDHSPSARDTIGFVRRLWLERDGDELHGELEFLGRENVERVRLGLWKQVSVSLSVRKPEMKLVEVSITPFPALVQARMFSQKCDDWDDGPGCREMDETPGVMEQFTRLQQQFDRLSRENARLEEAVKRREDEAAVEEFVRMGKTTPAMREAEMELLATLSPAQREIFSRCKALQPGFYQLKTFHGKILSRPGQVSREEAEREAEEILRFTSAGGSGGR